MGRPARCLGVDVGVPAVIFHPILYQAFTAMLYQQTFAAIGYQVIISALVCQRGAPLLPIAYPLGDGFDIVRRQYGRQENSYDGYSRIATAYAGDPE